MKPFTGARERVVATLPPALTVLAVGDTVRVKSGRVAAVIVTVTPAETDGPKVAFPAYDALTVCAPAERVDVLNTAFPPASSEIAPRVVLPSVNVAVPEGIAVPELGATAAVKLTLMPLATDVAELVSVVVVPMSTGGALTVTLTADDVLPP